MPGIQLALSSPVRSLLVTFLLIGTAAGASEPPNAAAQSVLEVSTPGGPQLARDRGAAAQLTAGSDSTGGALTRGPYLQLGTATSIVVRWRTSSPTESRVRFGLSPAALTEIVDVAGSRTDHEVRLTSLTPRTRYYYSVGTRDGALAGGDAAHTFVTAPLRGAATPMKIWVLGDSGTGQYHQRLVRDSYYAHANRAAPDLWLMLGDNAYENGLDHQYQYAVFDIYPEVLRRSVLWPALGNHDTANSIVESAAYPYHSIFTLPAAGEAGGVASGSESYYSFDYGNVHFISLDSMTADRSTMGPMLSWLRADLEATDQPWIIAFWHHPPYSKGSHDSDYSKHLVEMRQNALPVLEAGGVDLVLTGHSHSYERSYLIDSHYGHSRTFISTMKLNGGDGRPTGTGSYRKEGLSVTPHQGTVYAVVGSSATLGGGSLDHPAMVVSQKELGSLLVDIEGNRLHARFLRADGTFGDEFAIVKGEPRSDRRRAVRR